MKKAAMAVALLLWGIIPSHAVQYQMIDLGIGHSPTIGDVSNFRINDHGTILVTAYYWQLPHQRAIIGDDLHGWTEIGNLGGGETFSQGLNNLGQAVGYAVVGTKHHAFVWDRETGILDLTPNYLNGGSAYDINDLGQVVGTAAWGIFIYDFENGIRFLEGTRHLRPAHINNVGQIAGYGEMPLGTRRGFIWDETNGLRDIGDLGGNSVLVYGLNNLGKVVGISSVTVENRPRSFVWDSVNGMQRIPLPTDSDLEGAAAINDLGQVVGYYHIPNSPAQAYVWDQSNGLIDLPGLGGDSVASDINNCGVIIGAAHELDRTEHAVIWVPVPEPSSILALLCGVGACFGLRRR